MPISVCRHPHAGLAFLVLVLATCLALDASALDDRSTTSPVPIAVWIDSRHPGPPVPRTFLGLSFEAYSLPQIAKYATRGDLVQMLRSLGPGVLRFGGVTADTAVAWTDADTRRPRWASLGLRAADFGRLAQLARRSGWRVVLTIGFAHYDPRAAGREVAAAKAELGPWLAGIEVGNEPDSYARHGFRSAPWTPARYNAQVSAYRRAIAKVAPAVPLLGPDVSGSLAFLAWGPSTAVHQRPALLTGHHYPLGCNRTPRPTITNLLSPGIRLAEDQSLQRYLAVSRAHDIGFRLDETGSVSCGGTPGISNTFAAALWALDYIAHTMQAGAAGINFEGNPANCEGYTPVCGPTPSRVASGALTAQPEWYALLMSRQLIGDRPVRAIVSPHWADVDVVPLLGSGQLSLVVVDDDPPGARPVDLMLHLGSGFGTATVLRLAAPSRASTSRVLLDGSAVAADGSWTPRPLPKLPLRAGAVSVAVPPASAALVSVDRD
jgi:hypothetical protein